VTTFSMTDDKPDGAYLGVLLPHDRLEATIKHCLGDSVAIIVRRLGRYLFLSLGG